MRKGLSFSSSIDKLKRARTFRPKRVCHGLSRFAHLGPEAPGPLFETQAQIGNKRGMCSRPGWSGGFCMFLPLETRGSGVALVSASLRWEGISNLKHSMATHSSCMLYGQQTEWALVCEVHVV